MKELYIAPEVNRLAFLPQENLATQGGSFDDLLNPDKYGQQFGGLNPGESANLDVNV